MSYAMAAALQAAIYARLAGDAGLQSLVGGAVYDAVPDGPLPRLYVSLGDEEARDRSSVTGRGATHDIAVSVVTDGAGYRDAKTAAVAVSDALLGPVPTLARGRIVGLWFVQARARRAGSGDQRRVDLRFRAQVEDD
jgi:hypothetical protein